MSEYEDRWLPDPGDEPARRCRWCRGTGMCRGEPGDQPYPCPDCDGSGWEQADGDESDKAQNEEDEG